MERITIVGVGLIGGSFALAVRKAGFTGRILGVSSPETIRTALDHGVIDESLPLAQAAAQSDLIYLAQPIERILATLNELDAHVRPGTLITDAGSTKAAIVQRAKETIQRGRFVGGHPMAGKQSRGVAHAEPSLFSRHPYILTSREPELEQWIERIGAHLVVMDADEHDRLVALTSHVPQLISTALASSIASQSGAGRVAGPAAIDLTRLAMSSYDIWRDIFETNAGPIDAALDRFIVKLEDLRRNLRSPQMRDEFDRASAGAHALRHVQVL